MIGQCMICGVNPATHSLTKISNGKVSTLFLCDNCYQEYKGEIGTKFSLGDIFGNRRTINEKTCSDCGMTFSEYAKTGILGCPNCYSVFKEELLPRIMKIQGDTTHVGKVEKFERHDLLKMLASLQKKLEEAVSSHQYAEADRLNKQIIELNRQLNEGGDDDEI